MKVRLLTENQKNELVGQEYAPRCYFNPILDGNNNWIISNEEVAANTNPNFDWINGLPEIDYVPPSASIFGYVVSTGNTKVEACTSMDEVSLYCFYPGDTWQNITNTTILYTDPKCFNQAGTYFAEYGGEVWQLVEGVPQGSLQSCS